MYQDTNGTYSPRGFSFLPPVVKNLLIINFIFYVAQLGLETRGIDITKWLGLHYVKSDMFYPFQYITYMFLHANFSHLFFNMFALWMFGNSLENYWGGKRFLLYYMVTGVGAGLIQTLAVGFDISMMTRGIGMEAYPVSALTHYINNVQTIGASGAVFGLLLAFGICFPNTRIYLYFLFPIKAKWFVLLYGLLEFWGGVSNTMDGVAHFAHLGGMIFGFLLIWYWRKRGSRIH